MTTLLEQSDALRCLGSTMAKEYAQMRARTLKLDALATARFIKRTVELWLTGHQHEVALKLAQEEIA